MSGNPDRRRCVLRRVRLLAVAGLSLLAIPAGASAADRVYWGDQNGSVRVGNLNGSGSPSTLFSDPGGPFGVAIDPAAGRIYWGDFGSGGIQGGNLDGSGSPATLYTTPSRYPFGVAVDPAAGKIYWSDPNSGRIWVANLNGSGSPAILYTDTGGFPTGLAVDPAAGKIYWADNGPGTIRVANLNGSGSPATLYTDNATAGDPLGVAIDPAAGTIYWTDTQSGRIRFGNLSGSGSPATLFTDSGSAPGFLALLRSPEGVGAPVVAGGSSAGSLLSCSQGQWAPDLLGAFLYLAPSSFAYQWTRNGADIAGANSSSYSASVPGSYTCRVTATNQAGASAPQTSASHTIAPPVLSALRASPRKLSIAGRRVNGKCVEQTAKNAGHKSCRRPVKLSITYTLDAPATVTFTLKRSSPGRRVNGKCVKPTSKNRKHKRCTQLVTVPGKITTDGFAGTGRFTFTGQIGGTRIGPGSYQITATPSAGGTNGTPQNVTFQIVN